MKLLDEYRYVVCFSYEKSESELKERLLAMTNHSQHIENCLRDQQQQLAEAKLQFTQLDDEYQSTTERLNNEVSSCYVI